MKYSENPDEFNFRTVSAELRQIFHHFDKADTIIRVMEYDESEEGFPMSMVPPPEEDDIEAITQKLDDEGYEYRVEDNLFVTVIGE